MKIRCLFYKAKFGDKSIVDNLISLWTWSKYAHVEIWTVDTGPLDSQEWSYTDQYHPPRTKFYGTCWTSTMRGKDNGTVKRAASEVLKHPERWDYIEIEVDELDMIILMEYMTIEVDNNKGYAMRDLWKFVIGGLHKPDDSRNICSEFVGNALHRIGIFDKPGIISPKKVYQKLIAKGYEVKSL